MTDRIDGFIVTLDHDIREDDVRSTTEAIKHIKNVAFVQPLIAEIATAMARTRVRLELRRKLLDILDEE